MGFESKRIDCVCRENDIDPQAFLFIVNFILNGTIDSDLLPAISPIAIVEFLQNSHDYFLKYKFPHIRQNLTSALEETHNDINPAIIAFFDSYLEEVRKHFAYEEKKVFPYIRACKRGAYKLQHKRIQKTSRRSRRKAHGAEKHHTPILYYKPAQQDV
ncbi:hemerythrin domain-containing protein [Muribaculum intestinale]|uniref:hemerythrin domain-containing protein n=1 Tax=Muribaculum intestinale TaxID=1796646 RepID=UPI0025A9B941|nr:hemerythrin domain-containing protein [Muribaculum intestinale]